MLERHSPYYVKSFKSSSDRFLFRPRAPNGEVPGSYFAIFDGGRKDEWEWEGMKGKMKLTKINQFARFNQLMLFLGQNFFQGQSRDCGDCSRI